MREVSVRTAATGAPSRDTAPRRLSAVDGRRAVGEEHPDSASSGAVIDSIGGYRGIIYRAGGLWFDSTAVR